MDKEKLFADLSEALASDMAPTIGCTGPIGYIHAAAAAREAGAAISPVTAGPVVTDDLQTSIEGVFACGNVLHVHDLVDFVSEEAAAAGKNAAAYVKGTRTEEGGREITLDPTDGVRYTVPATVNTARMDDILTVRFRVGGVYKNCYVSAYFDDERVIHKKRQIVAPGEMEEIRLTKEQLAEYPDLKTITVKIEEA